MPQLSKEQATSADEASSSFDPMPDAVYVMRLREVKTMPPGKSGYPYWRWEFEVPDGEFKGRRQWSNTSLSPAAEWKLKEAFDAFGVPTDTNTDDLIGKSCRVVVSTTTIQSGAREGQPGNSVDALLPLDAGDAAAETGSGEKGTPVTDDAPF